jgi:hypothetical protein
MKKNTINVGDYSFDEFLSGQTGNFSAKLEILQILNQLRKDECFEIEIIEKSGKSKQLLKVKGCGK